jgi:hypothetical protein
MDAQFCGSCGTKRLSSTHRHCSSCGRQFAGTPENAVTEIPQSHNRLSASQRTTFAIVGPIVCAALLFWLLYEFLPNHNSGTEQTAPTTASEQPSGEQAQAPSLSVDEMIGRNGFCIIQEGVANGDYLPGEPALERGAAVLELADKISHDHALQVLQQAKNDYEAGKFSRDNCESYSAMERNWLLGRAQPF